MKNSKLFVALLLVLVMSMSSALGCTIFMAGKDATVDGSTMCSQTDDSGSADFKAVRALTTCRRLVSLTAPSTFDPLGKD